MLTQRQLCRRRIVRSILFVAALATVPCNAFAQEQDRPSFLADVAKRVVLDPTTYAPALIAYDATIRDWNSSQVFFQNGFVEQNPHFTISGQPKDIAMSYGAGKHRILNDAIANLEMSAVNNLTDAVIERMLIERHPEHRKLFRALGWIEKLSFAGFMSYQLSAAHFRQGQWNEQEARQLGLNR